MKHYVLCLVAHPSDPERFLFIQKARPEWQAGRWNFPGGSVLESEITDDEVLWRDAATREMKEETNVQVNPDEWHAIAQFITPSYSMLVFHATTEQVIWAKTMTDEPITSFGLLNVLCNPEMFIEECLWLAALAVAPGEPKFAEVTFPG